MSVLRFTRFFFSATSYSLKSLCLLKYRTHLCISRVFGRRC